MVKALGLTARTESLLRLGLSKAAEVTGFLDRMSVLDLEFAERLRTHPSEYWLNRLEEKGVPCGPVNTMLQALSDPQTLARDMVVEVEHTTLGPVKTLGLPVKFSRTPGKVTRKMDPPPGLSVTATSPRIAPTRCFTMDRPKPVPPISRDRPASTR